MLCDDAFDRYLHKSPVKHTILLNGFATAYSVRHSRRARNLRITIDPTRGLIATVPLAQHEQTVEPFLRKKARWILKYLSKAKRLEGKTIIKHSKREYEKNKLFVLKTVKERIAFFNSFYKFHHRMIRIRNQTSLWGSCTRTGNLQFNYKLVYLPKRSVDYIVVHELCHLKEHNHSQRFWKLVEKMIPDYKQIRRSLRQYVMQEG
jgi:predicted metal-dependent hydrolase